MFCSTMLGPRFVILLGYTCTVNTNLSSHSKIDKTKILKTEGKLMQVEGIAEWSLGPALSDNRSCLFVFFGGGHFRQFLLYMYATSSWWNGKVDL